MEKLGLNLDLDVSIKLDIIRKIIRSVSLSLLTPKAILGLMIALEINR